MKKIKKEKERKKVLEKGESTPRSPKFAGLGVGRWFSPGGGCGRLSGVPVSLSPGGPGGDMDVLRWSHAWKKKKVWGARGKNTLRGWGLPRLRQGLGGATWLSWGSHRVSPSLPKCLDLGAGGGGTHGLWGEVFVNGTFS